MQKDAVEIIKVEKELIIARVQGTDRAGVIAEATSCLEENRLYVESITFNLVLPSHDTYEMGIVARGGEQYIKNVESLIKEGNFLQPVDDHGAVRIHWPTAYLFHIALHTPDRGGLTAEISRIVDKSREVNARSRKGSFVHMVGITHNSGGPQGGTPFFSLRANVATYSIPLQNQIIEDLEDWASGDPLIETGHLWIRDLNP